MYWISGDDEFRSPFHLIAQTLFRLNSDRALTAIESAIYSYDPVVRKRAAMALVVWEVPLVDRNLLILLNAIDDPDLDVQIKIICGIREIIHLSMYAYNRLDITPELIDRATLETNPIVLKYINHPDLEIREHVISQLSEREAYTLGWQCRIRIKGKFLLRHPRHGWQQVNQFPLTLGSAQLIHNVEIHKHNSLTNVHLAIGWEETSGEKWYILSTEPTTLQTFREYGLRLTIEENLRSLSGRVSRPWKRPKPKMISRLALIGKTRSCVLLRLDLGCVW